MLGEINLPAADRARAQNAKVPVTRWTPDEGAYFIVSLDEASVTVTDFELALLRAYAEFSAASLYTETAVKRMLAEPYAADRGHNTVTFVKRDSGSWSHRRLTWVRGPSYWPGPGCTPERLDLPELLDRISDRRDWPQFKFDRPELFG